MLCKNLDGGHINLQHVARFGEPFQRETDKAWAVDCYGPSNEHLGCVHADDFNRFKAGNTLKPVGGGPTR